MEIPKFPKIRVTVKKVKGECYRGCKEGGQFIFEDFTKTPEGFCEGAAGVIFPCIYALTFGAEFPWEENTRAIHTTCPDEGKVMFLSEVLDDQGNPEIKKREKPPTPSPKKMVVTVEEAEGKCFYNYKKGDSFEFTGLRTPEGFCGAAYHSLFPVLFALNFGAQYPFEENKNSLAKVTCPDAGKIRFRVTRV